MDSKDHGRLTYEPPRLLRLTELGVGQAICQPSGSGAGGDCSNGNIPGNSYCVMTGSSAATVCSASGSAAGVCSGTGSSVVS